MDRLRAVEREDLSAIRRWRNHQSINRYMFTQHDVTESEHLAWFEASRGNKLISLFVYEEFGDIKGFIQLQQKSKRSGVYEWGFYKSPEATAGSGTKMANHLFNKVFEEMSGSKLYGEVLSFNQPSIKFHQKLGFCQEGLLRRHHRVNGQNYDVYCFGLLKPEWLRNRKRANSGK